MGIKAGVSGSHREGNRKRERSKEEGRERGYREEGEREGGTEEAWLEEGFLRPLTDPAGIPSSLNKHPDRPNSVLARELLPDCTDLGGGEGRCREGSCWPDDREVQAPMTTLPLAAWKAQLV